MRLAWIVPCLATTAMACNSLLGIGDFTTGDGPPVPPDLPPDCVGTIAPLCGQTFLDIFEIDGTIDTDNDPRCIIHAPTNGGPTMCAFVHGTINIRSNIRIIGTRPFMIAGAVVNIDDQIDATSTTGNPIRGAGADPDAECPDTPNGTDDSAGGSGGGGGTLASKGGDGGDNINDILGGIAPSAIAFTTIHGGCPGSRGGEGAGGTGTNGSGGSGGGAIYVAARESIAITSAGAIFVSGAGGEGAPNNTGGDGGGAGGGGGSGGMIVLDAPVIDILPTGQLVANGGAGGGGGDAAAGSNGANGTTVTHDVAAEAGAPESATAGGIGGDGAVIGVEAEDGSKPPTSGGGGGGGGGVGFIITTVPLASGQISPAPTMFP